jgi:hypothetical protein
MNRRHQLDTNFFNQFQQVRMYQPEHAKQYGNFIIRQFAGRQNEVPFIGKLSMHRMGNDAIINNLAVKLNEEDCPDSMSLLRLTEHLMSRLASYAGGEPYCAAYFNRLYEALKPFRELINTYYQNVQYNVLDKLNILLSGKSNEVDERYLTSETIDELQVVIGRYGNIAYGHCRQLESFLERDMGKGCPAHAITHVEQMVMNLLDLTERSIINAESTNDRLETWKKRLIKTETQHIYN